MDQELPTPDDEALLEDLRRIVNELDPIPEHVLAAAHAAIGWRTPVSLFAHCTHNKAGSLCNAASSAERSSSPSAPTGSTMASPAAKAAGPAGIAVAAGAHVVSRAASAAHQTAQDSTGQSETAEGPSGSN